MSKDKPLTLLAELAADMGESIYLWNHGAPLQNRTVVENAKTHGRTTVTTSPGLLSWVSRNVKRQGVPFFRYHSIFY